MNNYFDLIEVVALKAIQAKVFPGCVIGIVSKEEERITSYGGFTYDVAATKMAADSIFDVASVTKSIPTGLLALYLLDQKLIGLNDKVIKYLPDYNNKYAHSVKIKHLLTHTVEYGYRLSSLKDSPAEDILQIILTSPVINKPGSTYHYSNACSILMGLIVEKVMGMSLDQCAQEIYFGPLGMIDSTFNPAKHDLGRVVPTEIDPWRGGLVQGIVHDESAYKLSSIKKVGSAGLFTTAIDLALVIKMIMSWGEYDGRRYLSESIIKQSSTNMGGGLDNEMGLGWELNQSWFMGKYASNRTIGKVGFTGTSVVIDLKRGKSVIILSNCVYPKRPSDRVAINHFRREIAEIILK
jgi:CubicO group peptidase (beta-lactamase class C family)